MAWHIKDSLATVEGAQFVGSFNLKKPQLGLKLDCRDSALSLEQLFAIVVNDAPSETYVRGVDLVTEYPARSSDLVKYHSYYRLTDGGDGIGFILSAQTSLLESAPMTRVSNMFRPSEIFVQLGGDFTCVGESSDFDPTCAPSFFLIRPQGAADSSWVLLVHPSDFYRASVRVGANPAVAFGVFPDSLEKGVIRRACFQLRRVSRSSDYEQASQLLKDVLQASPPLAT